VPSDRLLEADASGDGGTLACIGDFVDRGLQLHMIINLVMARPQLPNGSNLTCRATRRR